MTGERYITIETLSGGFAAIWGTWVAYPYQDLFSRNPALYGPLLWIFGGSETICGLVVMTAGLIAIIASLRGWHILAPAITFVTFGLFAALYFVGDTSSPAWALWGLLAACNFMHAYFRATIWKPPA